MNNNKIGIGYIRTATYRQDANNTFIHQKDSVRETLIKLGCSEIHIYEDKGCSGMDLKKRTGLRRALRKANEHNSSYFCTYSLDRLSRKVLCGLEILELLERSNSELVCVDGSGNPLQLGLHKMLWEVRCKMK